MDPPLRFEQLTFSYSYPCVPTFLLVNYYYLLILRISYMSRLATMSLSDNIY